MSGKDRVVLINNNGVYKTKLPQRGAKLQDLLLVVGSGIVGIWH